VTRSLSVLILENCAADFELIVLELRRFGFVAECWRRETEAEFLAGLETRPDIILADFALTNFDALRALDVLKKSGLIIPFIVLTGAVGEETMVECMRQGASDYIFKQHVRRLGPAVKRALEESELRRQKQDVEQSLREKNVELEEQCLRAEAASRMKSAFVANMSHELRTPLTAIIGFSELLVDGKMGHVCIEHLDLLQDIVGNAKHLLGLINDVLDMAKVESGTMTFRPERTSVVEVVGETVAGLRVLAAERRVSLVSDIRTAEIVAVLDRQRLKQVLFNYVSNALKFSLPGGRVTIRAIQENKASLRLEVEDTGVGIAPDEVSKLFQDFHQLDGGLAKHVQGTGLGLALTKRLVEAQGGRVGVRSTPGEGSTFFAVLPVLTDRNAIDSSLRSGSSRCELAALPG
jgi:signal transduction histidine kinase